MTEEDLLQEFLAQEAQSEETLLAEFLQQPEPKKSPAETFMGYLKELSGNVYPDFRRQVGRTMDAFTGAVKGAVEDPVSAAVALPGAVVDMATSIPKHYAETYGSMPEALEQFKERPIETLQDLSLAGMGAGLATKLATGGKVGSGLMAKSAALDPLNLPLNLAAKPVTALGESRIPMSLVTDVTNITDPDVWRAKQAWDIKLNPKGQERAANISKEWSAEIDRLLNSVADEPLPRQAALNVLDAVKASIQPGANYRSNMTKVNGLVRDIEASTEALIKPVDVQRLKKASYDVLYSPRTGEKTPYTTGSVLGNTAIGNEARRFLEQDISVGPQVGAINEMLAPIEQLKLNLPKAIDKRQRAPIGMRNAAPPAFWATLGALAGSPQLGYGMAATSALGTMPRARMAIADFLDKGRKAGQFTNKWATGSYPSMIRQLLERGHLTEEERKQLGL